MSDSWSQHNSRVWGIDKPLLMRQGAERLSEGSGEMGCVPLGGQRTGGGGRSSWVWKETGFGNGNSRT